MVVTKSKFEIQKLAMERLEFFADGKIAFTYITKEDDKKIDFKPGDHDGVVEIGRSIEGVEISIFLYEKDKGFKASLRSNEYVDVSEICMMFGGGGHIKAAGATMNMSLEDAKKAILTEAKKYLK
jgi:phosphoesterase RecJ-like protein